MALSQYYDESIISPFENPQCGEVYVQDQKRVTLPISHHVYVIQRNICAEGLVVAKHIRYVRSPHDDQYFMDIKRQLADLAVREPHYQRKVANSERFKVPKFISLNIQETDATIDIIFRMERVFGEPVTDYNLCSEANQWLIDQGIHHNDLVDMSRFGEFNPGNLLLSDDGTYYILDFGNASDRHLPPRIG